ncbi:MAG: PilX N-terminal domain-containing pilus assembly protein [bacterium]
MRYIMSQLKIFKEDQEGMIMIIALILMVLLTSLGIAGIYLSTSDMKIVHNYKLSRQKFFTAEAALARGVKTLQNTSIDEWNALIEDATATNVFVELGLSGQPIRTIGGINYTVWVRNNFDEADPDNNYSPNVDRDAVLVLLAEAIGDGGKPRRIESAVEWVKKNKNNYGGKNIDAANSGSTTASIEWDPNG